MTRFYVTTPIYYVNDVPHIGHSYTTIIADIIARWNRLKGRNVFFLTGTDENSVKTVRAAKENGYQDIKKYADEMVEKWKNVWKILNISNTDFIRTTEKRHADTVKDFFNKVYKNGDIYKGTYEGLYCEGCENFLTKSELIGDLCLYHKTKPKSISEENYFFRLSKYQQRLEQFFKENPDFIQPKSRMNEVVSFLKTGLKDVSISRPNLEWGIELPIDKNQRIWVWFDALINYISGGNWPADLHILGKDIIRFHCIIWPAMLMSVGEKLPKKIYVHGFFTANGQKISKSLGNAIDPVALAEKYSVDALRYFFIREIPMGEDGDFSEKALIERINGELVSDLGNLVNRVVTIGEKFAGKIEGKDELSSKLNLDKIEELMEGFQFHLAIKEIFNFIRECNRYINQKEPWRLKDKELGHVLYNLAEALRVIAVLLHPFMPETSEKIRQQLGLKELGHIKFGKFKGKIKKGELLFRKVK